MSEEGELFSNGKTRHGTDAGYYKHRREGSTLCDPCRVAHNEARARQLRDNPESKERARKSSQAYAQRKQAERVRQREEAVREDPELFANGKTRHGTRAGYCKHQREGTPACAPCLAANSEYQNSRFKSVPSSSKAKESARKSQKAYYQRKRAEVVRQREAKKRALSRLVDTRSDELEQMYIEELQKETT